MSVCSLKESGLTALGPALVCSIGMASRGSAGSQVIICTDGLANLGRLVTVTQVAYCVAQ